LTTLLAAEPLLTPIETRPSGGMADGQVPATPVDQLQVTVEPRRST
jgi:hypothetical protein